MGKKKETMGLFEAIARAQQKKQTTGIAIPSWMQKKGLVPKNYVPPQSTESEEESVGSAAAVKPSVAESQPPVAPASKPAEQAPAPAKPVEPVPEAAVKQEQQAKTLDTRQQRLFKPLVSDQMAEEQPAKPAKKEIVPEPMPQAQKAVQQPSRENQPKESPAPEKFQRPVPPAAAKPEPVFQSPDRDMLRPKVATQPAVQFIGGRMHLTASGGVCLIVGVSAIMVLVLSFMLGWVLGGRNAKVAVPQPPAKPENTKPATQPVHPPPAEPVRVAGKFYILFKVMDGNSDKDSAEAEKFIGSLKSKGETAGIVTIAKQGKDYFGVLGFTPYSSADSEKAKECIKKLKSLGLEPLEKKSDDGSNGPVCIPWK